MFGLDELLWQAEQYLDKAVAARENFYTGLEQAADEAYDSRHPNMGPKDAKYRFAKSVKGQQLINDNKWHMAQARTFALIAIAQACWKLRKEQQVTNDLLRQLINKEK